MTRFYFEKEQNDNMSFGSMRDTKTGKELSLIEYTSRLKDVKPNDFVYLYGESVKNGRDEREFVWEESLDDGGWRHIIKDEPYCYFSRTTKNTEEIKRFWDLWLGVK